MTSSPDREPLPTRIDDIVVALTPSLRGRLSGFRFDRYQAEDVLQDVWLQLLLNRHKIRDPQRVAAWLRTTANRAAIRVATRRLREMPVEIIADRIPAADDPTERATQAALSEALWRAVHRLPERDRRLAMLLARDLSYADIALRLGVAENSVGQLRTRCLRRLRRILAQEGIHDSGY